MPEPHGTRIMLAAAMGITAGTANLAGGLLIVRRQWSQAYLKYFVALGAGFMLATAFLEMIPESLRLRTGSDGSGVLILVLAGYLVVHLFEHTVAPHFHFGEETHHEEMAPAHASYAALLGLLIHTFFDGVAIASGVLVSPALGAVIFLAVFLHKLPEGFAVSSLMLASGQSRGAALGAAALLGGATLLGVGVMYALRGAVADALPFSAGVTVYVAASDLIPEVNKEPRARMALIVFVGVAVMLLLRRLFHL
jgi:zinc and cadmium transporter